MDKTDWIMLHAEGWKFHWAPASLLEGLTLDAVRRFHTINDVEPATQGFIDLPGMCMMDRSIQTFEIDGFKLSIPTQDMEYYFAELSAPVRTFKTGEKYVKLHGRLHCLVLTEDQRNRLLAQLDMPAILEKARQENEEFTRRIRSINEDGVKVVSPRDPKSLEGVVKLVSKPNDEKN